MTLLAALVATSQRVRASRSRRVKVRELASLLRSLAPAEIDLATHYLAGDTPQGRIGVGYAALAAAAQTAAAASASLSLTEIDRRLSALAQLRGAGSAPRRAADLGALFARATREEQLFLLHLLAGELRQGALEGLMLEAIAAAAALPVTEVRRAAMYAGSRVACASALTQGSLVCDASSSSSSPPWRPCSRRRPPTWAPHCARCPGELAFEWKLDGARVQVHKRGPEVRIYTRALNEVTAALPEIVEVARALLPAELILDGEVIALDAADRPRPFQITMRRFGRKLDVEALRGEIALRAFFFDCLRLEERILAECPTQERFAALAAAVPQTARVPRLVTASEAQARAFYLDALAAGHEGVMAKALAAPYEAGNRGASWLKIKRAHTLDLVVLAAEWGHGRRSGKLSNLHLGALEPATGVYVMLGKTFKGLTDELLQWQTAQLLAREQHRDEWTVYVRPELVVEIAFSDLQASRRYPGGVALRLARVKRYRSDKSAAEADTMESVRGLFAAQSGSRRQGA